MFNKVILIGNLTKKPILRVTTSGSPVVDMRIAVTTKVAEKEETLFITVVAFGNQANNCFQYLDKGAPVLVEGRLRERSWVDEKNQKQTTVEVVATRVKFLHRRKHDQNQEKPQLEVEENEDLEIEAF
jgi:single-strand DNA-binding protein